jgi:hypothetical protein
VNLRHNTKTGINMESEKINKTPISHGIPNIVPLEFPKRGQSQSGTEKNI